MTATVSLHHLLSQALTDPESAEMADRLYPFVPLDAPGMPPAGPDFLAAAIAMGDAIDSKIVKRKKEPPTGDNLKYLYRRALYDPGCSLRIAIKGGETFVRFTPGHIWMPGGDRPLGPKRAKIMIVGKIPGPEELSQQRALVGRGSQPLLDALAELGVPEGEYSTWYVTFACKFGSPTPDTPAIPAAWLKDCAPLLAQELRLVQPEYILCMGNEAAKAVLQTSGSVSGLSGRVLPIEYQDEHGGKHAVKVMTCLNPAYVARKPEAYEDFKGQLSRFLDMTRGRMKTAEEVDHAEIYTEEALTELVDAMLADRTPNANIIAVDCEWHGDHPTEPGSYLRTVQVSNQDRWARTIVLRYDGGAEAFRPNLDAARVQLNRLLKSTPDRHVRVGGHFFRADLPWLLAFGVDVRDEYAPAEDSNDREHGGWDTSLMYHAVNETAKFGLDECSLRFTTAPTYWEALDKWKKRYRAKKKIKAGDLGGYGIIPGDVLHPYASYDVDVTRRICMRFYGTNGRDGLLASDVYGNDCWLPYWTAHQASLAFLEMEQTGMVIDRGRSDEITTLFMNTQERLLAEIREELCWPKFNPKSQPQLAVALFGRDFRGRYTTKIEVPDDARPLDLTPIKTTGKRPTLWHELGYRGGNADTATPSTDKESLGILGHANETAAKIRDYKFVAQVLQSVLRKPNMNDAGEFETDEEGHYEYDKGLIGAAHSDGKVRTHLFQTKETGRASSSRPPLQNLSSRREADYKRILGSAHQHPVRSILRVPEGCVGIETDLTGAELAVLAWLSQDKNFIEHVRRNILPENHPDHYDIHSQQAVKAFKLSGVVPTKHGMESAGKKGLRIAAKCVVAGTRLHTSRGWVVVDELAGHLAPGQWEDYPAGTTVANDGQSTPLLGVYNGGIQPCLRVTTDCGYSLASTYVHKYRVVDENGEYCFREAGQLKIGDWVAVRKQLGPFGDDVRFPKIECPRRTSFKSINFPDAFDDDWAAFCGLYVSEGTADQKTGSVQIGISVEYCPEFATRVDELLARLFGDRLVVSETDGARRYRIMAVELARWLVAHFGRLSGDKVLPDFVFQWPQRLLSVFLSWAFEGDGTVKTNGGSFTVSYTSKSPSLVTDIQTLLTMFGVICTRAKEERESYPGNCYWTLTIRGNASKQAFVQRIGFVTDRKKDKCQSTGAYQQDRDIIPNQHAKLERLLTFVDVQMREKCRECVRENHRIALSPTRLTAILMATDVEDKYIQARADCAALARLRDLPVSFQQVAAIEAIGEQQVYDVTTDNEHVVCYDGLLTHQTVNFGIPYGRGPEAIARQCKEESKDCADITAEQCQAMIDAYFRSYPGTKDFLAECRKRSQDPGWLVGPYGRYRRFMPASERSVIGEQERQAQNFPIQGGVADAVSIALNNFYQYRREHPDVQYDIALQIHDAIMLIVPIEHAYRVYHEVVPKCMVDDVPFWPRYLNGTPIPVAEPYHFGMDREIFVHWGEKLKPEQAKAYGLTWLYDQG